MKPFNFPNQTSFYSGKVRDVYTFNNHILLMIASNRISAFDVILPKPIPYKGQVLNQIAAYMLEQTSSICKNWLLETPTPYASIGKKCQPFKIELVIRGYLAGYAWRVYSNGLRTLCGVALPEGLKENDKLPHPIITPSTKADEGHDEDISKEEIITNGLATAAEWEQLEKLALQLYNKGQALANERGLILVDTKYEFGKLNDEIILMDEIHTPDSSRYFYMDGYEERQLKGEKQKQLSKEFVREWLIDNNFMGKEGQTVPEMTDEWIDTISKRYIELYEILIGKPFEPAEWNETVEFNTITKALTTYNI